MIVALSIVAAMAVMLAVIPFFGASIKAGAVSDYECPDCHEIFVPNKIWIMLTSFHLGKYRLLTCPKCSYKGLMKGIEH